MIKKGFVILLVVLLIFSCITGCVKQDSTSTLDSASTVPSAKEPSSSSKGTEPIKMRMTFWGNEHFLKMFEEVIELHKSKYTNVDVEPILIPYSDYADKITVMLASGAPPDTSWLASDHVLQHIENESLLDISKKVFDDSIYDFADIYESATLHLRYGDALYGLPTNAAPKVVFVNKELLKAAGLPDPNSLGKGWTYNKVLEYARAMTDTSKGIYGVNIIADWKSWFGGLLDLIWSYGGAVMSDDNKQFIMNSPETAKALQFFSDLMFVHKVHPLAGDQMTFDSGKIALCFDNYSLTGKLKEVSFDWDIAPLPFGENNEPIWVGSSCFAVFKDGAHTAEATDLAKTITSKEGQTIMMSLVVPSRESLQKSETFLKKQTPPSPEAVQSAFISRLAGPGKCFVTPSGWIPINAAIQSSLDELFGQTADVKTVLEKMDKEVNEILK